MFGLYGKKGTLAPAAEQTMSAEIHHMNVDYSAYEGKKVTGQVETVLSRGELVIDRREYAGHGVYLPRGVSQYLG
ncbi:D-hydantoinase [Streptomyces sp. RB5]|uniref:D-hydantoinase n=1 Tax=Streptomyces smaragdinus TaxID=2585196 RepID=A0A7K0CM84_9ACTN|nr:D-hydantoinase [Streptomyces smaragdinus]